MARASGFAAEIDPAQFRRFQRDLKQLDPELRKELNKKLRRFVATMVIPAAKGSASWSSRIPGKIRPRVAGKGVGLRVASGGAPHARPLEGISGPTFRHPVFGNRNNWVTQSARPFLKPAVDAHRDEFMEAAGKALDEAAQQTGWK